MSESADLIEIKPKIRLTQSIETVSSNDYFSILGFEISKLYVFLLLACVLLLCIWLIWKWYFDKDLDDSTEDQDTENKESVSFEEQQDIENE